MSARNVFIDTSIFHAAKYDYDRVAFKRLLELVKAGSVNVVTTSVTTREIEAKIDAAVEEARRAAKRFRRDAPILAEQRFPEFDAVFSRLDASGLKTRMKGRFRDYMRDCNALEVSIESGSIRSVFEDYFEPRPPFAGGEKKSEFPDAFVIVALERWCAERDEECVVVSLDEGLRDASERIPLLQGLESLEEFVEIVTKEEQSTLALAASKAFERSTTDIARAVQRAFENLGFWIDQPEGDVLEVVVTQVHMHDEFLVDVKGLPAATFELPVNFHFDAAVQYADPETGIWDSEDRRMLFQETIDTTLSLEETLDVEVTFRFDFEDLDVFEIETATVNRGKAIEVRLWDESDRYY